MITRADMRLNYYWPNARTQKYRYQLTRTGGFKEGSIDEEGFRRIFQAHHAEGGLDLIPSQAAFIVYIEIPAGITASVLEAFLADVSEYLRGG